MDRVAMVRTMLDEAYGRLRGRLEDLTDAEFFGSDEEMRRKVLYYLAQEDERRAIAASGRERCVRGGYSNIDRLSRIVDRIVEKMR